MDDLARHRLKRHLEFSRRNLTWLLGWHLDEWLAADALPLDVRDSLRRQLEITRGLALVVLRDAAGAGELEVEALAHRVDVERVAEQLYKALAEAERRVALTPR